MVYSLGTERVCEMTRRSTNLGNGRRGWIQLRSLDPEAGVRRDSKRRRFVPGVRLVAGLTGFQLRHCEEVCAASLVQGDTQGGAS